MTEKIPSYTPATREQLAQMDDKQLLSQYHSLIDLLKETRGFSFERTPSCGRDELARLIWEGQMNYPRTILAGALMAWAERTGRLDEPILVIDDGCCDGCPYSQGGQR